MPREDYQRRLETLRANVLDMSTLVLVRLESALTAMETGDDELIY